MATNWLGHSLPDEHCMVDHKCNSEDCFEDCIPDPRLQSGGKPYIVWCDLWELARSEYGLSDMHDILGHFHRQKVEMKLFKQRGNPAWISIPMDEWEKTKPVDMPPLWREFSDALNAYRNSEEYKEKIPPYRNLWHLILDKVWSGGSEFTRDGFNHWPNDYFDLKKWPKWAHVYILFLDNVTHNHPARDQEGINFFIYW